jgi:hypothetical protein
MAKGKQLTPKQFLNRVRDMELDYRAAQPLIKADIAKEAKEHYDRSFQKEGFTDSRFIKWPKRSPNRRPKDPTLYETGKLSSSTKVRILTRGVSIINGTKYAGYHNYGKGQKLRKFIGNSIQLNRKIIKIIKDTVRITLKP